MRRDYRLLMASAATLALVPLSAAALPLSGHLSTIGIESIQQAADTYQLTGKVVDENGVALPGVNIIIQGTKRGVSTDVDGKFTIEVKKTDVLRMSFIGYKDEYVPVKGRTSVKVDMTPDSHTLQDVQVVAFGTQKKESVVSSITTIRPGDLRTSSSDLTTSFAGRIPGMIAWQTGGLPGALTENEMNTKFYVRGITSFQSNANTDPLILIDGVESSKLDLSRLTVEDIETFNVMKDAFEGRRYWNLLRWKEGAELGEPLKGWNIVGSTDEAFYNNWQGPVTVWSKRKFVAPRDYFFPIRSEERMNAGIVQNPGW